MTTAIEPVFETAGRPGIDRAPVLVSYGMGVDSTAMILGLIEQGTLPDVITSADTGGEVPDTYRYLFLFDDFLAKQGFPRYPNTWVRPPNYENPVFGLPETHELQCIVSVRNTGKYGTLEKNCTEKKMLPSLAYGGRSCSEKYKIRPQHQWVKNNWEPAKLWWKLDHRGHRPDVARWAEHGRLCIRLIGYDAGELRRSDIRADGFYEYRYPLRVWGWKREDCLKAIERHGLPVTKKSACFFCPASKRAEIVELGRSYPDLLQRALDMEKLAQENSLTSVKGLGRNWSWQDHIGGQKAPQEPKAAYLGCICQGEIYEDQPIDAENELDLDVWQDAIEGKGGTAS